MKILSEADVKEILGIQDKKARGLMRSEGFPSKRIGGTYYVEEQDFYNWFNNIKDFKIDYKGV